MIRFRVRDLVGLGFLWLAALLLVGCTIVTVHTDDGRPPKLSAWLGGVRVESAPGGAATMVNTLAIGPSRVTDCDSRQTTLLFSRTRCAEVTDACGIGLWERAPRERSILAKISDETRAHCLRSKKETTK